MGGARVGKTAIVQQFLFDTFPATHVPTVEELHKSEYDVRGLGKLVNVTTFPPTLNLQERSGLKSSTPAEVTTFRP